MSSLFRKRHIEESQKLTTLLISLSRRNENDIHTSDLVYLIIFNFRENQLLLDAKCVVSSAIECIRVYTTEVTDTGKCKIDKTIQEFVHSVTAERNLAANRHSLFATEFLAFV